MNTTKKIILAVVLVACAILTVVYWNSGKKFGDVTNFNPLYGGTVTNSGVLCTSSSGLLLATSSAGRPFVVISNDSANKIFLGLGYSASADTGLYIPANTMYTLNQNATYLGAIYCISSGGNATATLSYIN